MTPEDMMTRIHDELDKSGGWPIDISKLVSSCYPEDYDAGRALCKLFDARLLRGYYVWKPFEWKGHISGIADDTRPIWH